MVFVDTNVFMYAVGRPHPLREHAQSALKGATGRLATSAEVLQELLHAYLPVGRLTDLDRALQLATDLTTVWPVDAGDVRAARELVVAHPGLPARDLLHLAVCRRHAAARVLSFDRALVAASSRA
jgi:predicted nucleic acid-binding protein